MSQFPTRKTIHDDYFESLEDFLNSSPKITKSDGTCKSTPHSVLSYQDSKNIIAIGNSKKEAEQKAAKKLLTSLKLL